MLRDIFMKGNKSKPSYFINFFPLSGNQEEKSEPGRRATYDFGGPASQTARPSKHRAIQTCKVPKRDFNMEILLCVDS
jgi:hypothetical protein